MDEIPYFYCYLYWKIKEKGRTMFISQSLLCEILSRCAVKNGFSPHFMNRYIIDDLISLNLLERISSSNYRIIERKECYKKIKRILDIYT